MSTSLTVLAALTFFCIVFGPLVVAIFRDPFYGAVEGPFTDWFRRLADSGPAADL